MKFEAQSAADREPHDEPENVSEFRREVVGDMRRLSAKIGRVFAEPDDPYELLSLEEAQGRHRLFVRDVETLGELVGVVTLIAGGIASATEFTGDQPSTFRGLVTESLVPFAGKVAGTVGVVGAQIVTQSSFVEDNDPEFTVARYCLESPQRPEDHDRYRLVPVAETMPPDFQATLDVSDVETWWNRIHEDNQLIADARMNPDFQLYDVPVTDSGVYGEQEMPKRRLAEAIDVDAVITEGLDNAYYGLQSLNHDTRLMTMNERRGEWLDQSARLNVVLTPATVVALGLTVGEVVGNALLRQNVTAIIQAREVVKDVAMYVFPVALGWLGTSVAQGLQDPAYKRDWYALEEKDISK